MTVLWEKTVEGTHYSVRQAGESIRLYSNRVFHSQWNPQRPMAGAVWDCLSLPVLFRQENDIRQGALLGVGGGAVLRQLRLLNNFESFTGVELDEVHLRIAREWFGIEAEHANLEHDDAVGWLWRYSGQPFDLLIDDLFGHDEHEPLRAQPLDNEWVGRLADMTAPNGILVVNCIDRAELNRSRALFKQVGFSSGVAFCQAQYDNVIGVFSRRELDLKQWNSALTDSQLSPSAQRIARSVLRRRLW